MMHKQIYDEILSLLDEDHPWMMVLLTVVCSVHHGFNHVQWTEFYCVFEPEILSVGPYQGGHGDL
jgi:L-methionine (R)-S-oxide reductase